MKKRLIILAILSISASAFAMKEEAPVQKLNETTITTPERFGTKIRNVAKNIQIVTKKDMEEKGAKNLFEALRGVPGVVLRRDGGGHIDLRGSGENDKRNMIFLIDGIPYSGLSIFDINSISISVRYGAPMVAEDIAKKIGRKNKNTRIKILIIKNEL